MTMHGMVRWPIVACLLGLSACSADEPLVPLDDLAHQLALGVCTQAFRCVGGRLPLPYSLLQPYFGSPGACADALAPFYENTVVSPTNAGLRCDLDTSRCVAAPAPVGAACMTPADCATAVCGSDGQCAPMACTPIP